MRGSSEAFWWSLFSAGSVVAAMLIPVLIFATALAPGFGWSVFSDALSYGEIRDLLGNPLVKIVLFAGISLVLFFAVHRIRHLIIDLHAPVPGLALTAVSYLSAAAGAVLTAILLWRI
ncbi:MAG: fumarate reductase subunit D [Chloroflexi bacterium]|nr:fumarate reductase subunit D [Chloroflexota bacterium]MCY3936818.1 fumarate reductase subunit D [Chloroflexota bacterium]